MTEPAPTTGDYGYDMAHGDRPPQEIRGGGTPDARRRPPLAGPPPDPGTVDLAGDYGYDSAHDFRR